MNKFILVPSLFSAFVFVLPGFAQQYQGGVEQNIQLPQAQQLYPQQPIQPPPQYQPEYYGQLQNNDVLHRGPSIPVTDPQALASMARCTQMTQQIEYYKQTHGGMPPAFLPINAPTGPPVIIGGASGGQASRVLSWDEWYRRVSAVDEPLVQQALASHGYPTGNAHLWVTVTPSHHLSVELQDATSSVFGQAALAGVRALDGNAVLEYPMGSKRETFSFQWTSNHQGTPGRPPDIVNRTGIVGDYERQYRQW